VTTSALLSRKEQEMATELAVARSEVDDYERRLAVRLTERIYQMCKNNGVLFIFLDIPQAGEPGEFASSIPSDLRHEFERNSDALIHSQEVLSPYWHLAEFHVPNGQRHISELSHMLLDVAASQVIQHLTAPASKVANGDALATRKWVSLRQAPISTSTGRTVDPVRNGGIFRDGTDPSLMHRSTLQNTVHHPRRKLKQRRPLGERSATVSRRREVHPLRRRVNRSAEPTPSAWLEAPGNPQPLSESAPAVDSPARKGSPPCAA
jgi:hypothetical protein